MSRWGAVILTVCLTLAQGPGIAVLSNGKWVPDLWMSAVIISALAFEKRTAVFLAAAGGLIQDILTGNFFGLHFFPYLVIVLIVSAAVKVRYNRRWLVSVLTVAGGSAVYVFLSCGIILLSGAELSLFSYFLYRGLPQILLNTVAAMVLHSVIWNMKRKWEPKW